MNSQLQKKINTLANKEHYTEIKYVLLKQDFHIIADVINHLPRNKRQIFSELPPEIQSEVTLHLAEDSKQEILPKISMYDIARFLHFNDADDATDILQYLPVEKRSKILEKLKEEKRKKIEKLLKYGRETAGGVMDLDYIIVKDTFTFKDIAEKLQEHIDREKKVPFILLAQEDGKIIGHIPHKNLIYSSPTTPASKLSEPLPLIKHSLDQEKILNKMKDRKSEAVGVVDDDEKIVGVIHVRDLVRIAQSEATEDVYGFAGVEREEAPNDRIGIKVNRRYKWLIINLATAFLASSVVGLFQDTISKVALLAVFMPVVAGEGGNTATQSLAVVVRGLAMEEISWMEAKGIIFKEAIAGLINGIIMGITAACVAIIFGAPVMLGAILGTAMIVNLFVAGLFGALVPFILKSFKIDPAIASSVFVTTVTDIVGFFIFLGLGTLLLL
jgi:magnesium transporter